MMEYFHPEMTTEHRFSILIKDSNLHIKFYLYYIPNFGFNKKKTKYINIDLTLLVRRVW